MAQELSRSLSGRPLEFGSLSSFQKTNVESVGALIYAQETNRYLFLLRSGDRFAGTWSIAGGKVEPDEIIISALYRETQEEIGYDISRSKIIPLETFTTENNYFCYHTFLVLVEKEFIPTLNHEHSGYAWAPITSVPKPTHPGLFKTIHLEEILTKIKTVESFSILV